MKPCCLTTARRQLKKARQAAVCDACGLLLTTYDNDRDYEEAKKAISAQGLLFEEGRLGALRLLTKSRRRPPGTQNSLAPSGRGQG